MGCSASFPEDEAKFLAGTAFPPAHKYLDESLVSRTSPSSFCLRKGLTKDRTEYVVRRSDGSALCTVENTARRLRIKNQATELIALMVHHVRVSEVNGIDAAFNLPHVYVYAARPYMEGPSEADFMDGDAPSYLWARVHKTSVSPSCNTYEVALAEGRRSGENLNIEMFKGSAFDMRNFGGGKVAIKWNGKGAARVTSAAFDFDCENCYGVVTAQNVDPVLMMCCLFAMESLG